MAENGKIRNNGAGTLAKELVFVKINEFIQVELMQKEVNEREEALEARRRATPMSNNEIEWLKKRIEHLEERRN